MKRFILFVCAIFLGCSLSAQTMTVYVSGTITSDSSGTPVPNHQVIIHSDSSSGFYFYTTRTTGTNGMYDCAIHDVPTSPPITFYVGTYDCNDHFIYHSFLSTHSPAVVNFLICVDAPQECQAHYTCTADSLHPLHVHFFDTSTPQDQITVRYWQFGDGGTADGHDPWHVYAHPGKYNVCLTIHTSGGCTSTFCDSITVHENNPTSCESNFTYTSNFLTLTFHGYTSSPYPTTYTWHMGDPANTTLTGQNVTFTYPAQGQYTVILHTVDSTGCEFTRTKEVYAHATTTLYGHVHMGIHPVDHGWIQLIKVDSGVMNVVQEKEFGDSTGYYCFGSVGQGHYYLKAWLLPASYRYGHFMPTYYEQSLTWQNATLIELGSPQNPYIFSLIECGGNAPGSGNIDGVITEGMKYSGSGIGVPGIEVMLLDPANAPLWYATTDTAGRFVFPDIAFGTYIVKPEKAGALSAGAQIAIDVNKPSVSLPFTLNNGQIIYGINDHSSDLTVMGEVYPNPVTDSKARIFISSMKEMNVQLILYNSLGQSVYHSGSLIHAGPNTLELLLPDLREGPYFLKIQLPDEKTVIRRLTILHSSR